MVGLQQQTKLNSTGSVTLCDLRAVADSYVVLLMCQTQCMNYFFLPFWLQFNSQISGQEDHLREILGSLRNHDGDAEENVDYKLNFYFTYESRATIKSFALFITVETIAKLNPETKRYI